LIVNVITRELEIRIRLEFDSVQSPCYDPTGEKIVFSALKNGQTDLFILDLIKQQIDYLTNDPFNDSSPSWHPAGNKIAYTSERDGKDQLVILNMSETNQKVIDIGQHNVATPSWSPDGNKLIFCADISGVFDLFTINSEVTKHIDFTRSTNLMVGCSSPQF
jgi:TolB protein